MIGAWTIETTPTSLPAPALVPGEGIDQIAFLVGGTWVSSVSDETCTWGPYNRSILTVVVLHSDGQVTGHGRGSFNWDAAQEKLVCQSTIQQGKNEQRMVGNQITQLGSNNQWHFDTQFIIDDVVQRRRMTLTQLGPDEMRVDQYQNLDGKEVLLVSMPFTRKT